MVQVLIVFSILCKCTSKIKNTSDYMLYKYPIVFTCCHIFSTLAVNVSAKKIDFKFDKFIMICSSLAVWCNCLMPLFMNTVVQTSSSNHAFYQDILFVVILSFFVGEVLGMLSFFVERILNTIICAVVNMITSDLSDQ